MAQLGTGELEKYVRVLGEHMKSLYAKIGEINAKIGEINAKIEEVEKTITDLRAEVMNDVNITSDLKEKAVLKSEFDEFVHRLTESLRDLMPSVPETESLPDEQ